GPQGIGEPVRQIPDPVEAEAFLAAVLVDEDQRQPAVPGCVPVADGGADIEELGNLPGEPLAEPVVIVLQRQHQPARRVAPGGGAAAAFASSPPAWSSSGAGGSAKSSATSAARRSSTARWFT